MRTAAKLIVAAILTLPATGGLAQTQGEAPHPAETDKVIPEKRAPPLNDSSTGEPQSLSDKLKQTNGVISPPAGVDPEMRKPTPPQGDNPMPVIPPPGSPGGRNDIQPK